MRLTFLLASLLVISYIVSISCVTCTGKEFSNFKQTYNRQYASEVEHENRFQIFCKNLQEAEKLNKLNPQATFGVTKFSDLTKEEFKQRFLGTKVPKTLPEPTRNTTLTVNLATLPSVFDWRNSTKPVLTPIYNQEQCGSCWSFSATESIESVWAIAGNPLVELSMQQMIDCDTSDDGCNGGYPSTAIDYIVKAGGQEPFAEYPYTAEQGSCGFVESKIVAKVSGWEDAGTKDETAMATYLSTKAPLSVCVDASTWDSYQSGIISSVSCGTNIDHAVMAVAYNLEEKYWTIRNSWGADWGEDGYIRLEFGANTCDVATLPISAYIL